MLIFVSEAKDIDPQALTLLRDTSWEVLESLESALARAPEVVALYVRTYTTVDVAYLNQFPNLKYCLRAGVGLDNIDVAACKEKNIKVINSPGANANAVAEYVVATALVSLRNVNQQSAMIQKNEWRDQSLMGSEIKNKTLGLVGCGNVGKMIAHKLSTFELKEVIGYDPFLTAEQLQVAGIRKVELPEVISNSDILSLHVPLLPETKHLINKESLASMKQGSLLINAARGGVVDEMALVESLASGHLHGAVLDVFETEPLVHDSLKALPQVILTPHIGGYTHEANVEVSLAPVRELLRVAGNA